VAPCPTKALDVADRQTMTVVFYRERCIACEICLKVCPYQAMKILFD
jgi:L-aspartate semialdehyde sulfurtransferase ferredoxin